MRHLLQDAGLHVHALYRDPASPSLNQYDVLETPGLARPASLDRLSWPASACRARSSSSQLAVWEHRYHHPALSRSCSPRIKRARSGKCSLAPNIFQRISGFNVNTLGRFSPTELAGFADAKIFVRRRIVEPPFNGERAVFG